jgi:hypothetical protein
MDSTSKSYMPLAVKWMKGLIVTAEGAFVGALIQAASTSGFNLANTNWKAMLMSAGAVALVSIGRYLQTSPLEPTPAIVVAPTPAPVVTPTPAPTAGVVSVTTATK